MATLPTDFKVTKTRTCPIASPPFPLARPKPKNAEDASSSPKPSLIESIIVDFLESPDVIDAKQPASITNPNEATPRDEADIDVPSNATAENKQDVNAPSVKSAVAVSDLPVPAQATAEDAATVATPSNKTVLAKQNAPAPTTLTANPATPTVPPFPLNHARIQYDNVLFNNSSVFVSGGLNGNFAIIPNTFQRWEFSATGSDSITITLPANIDIDTVAIGAHNLTGADVDFEYSAATTGSFINIETKSIVTDNSAMAYLSSPVSARRVRITVVNGVGSLYIGYISAGESLQMQRPFFGGHTPITDAQVTELYTNRTETYNAIGRDVRRRGQENSASWKYIDDTWYRTYLEPIKETLNKFPFFFAWNLLEYPDDVGFCELTQDIQAPYSGTRSLRSLEIPMRGTL